MIPYKKVLSYIVGILYDLKKEGQDGYFSLRDILNVLKYPFTSADLLDIAKYLEAQGYVRSLYVLGGPSVQIAPRGLLFVEEQPGLIAEIEAHIKTARPRQQTGSKTIEELMQERKPIFEVLDKIIADLKEKLGPQGNDAIQDASVLRAELHKSQPDATLVSHKMNALAEIDFLRPQHRTLSDLINFD